MSSHDPSLSRIGANTVLDVVVDDAVEFFFCETIVFCKHGVHMKHLQEAPTAIKRCPLHVEVRHFTVYGPISRSHPTDAPTEAYWVVVYGYPDDHSLPVVSNEREYKTEANAIIGSEELAAQLNLPLEREVRRFTKDHTMYERD
jgi:hypothetical protein